ncbi:hypothetical protein PHAMO_80039 [Magnetospirillum molischianum DSM 120]|uniref:Uncharacterized protein n=1 Tax=Magnetospirillum molischianum DSM 120 TaxID=1150626 RepID=H8FY10_MAGML|nr:hypothetical protein PHAMO_80039 [Magnetospirillum molischianum DSM 120]
MFTYVVFPPSLLQVHGVNPMVVLGGDELQALSDGCQCRLGHLLVLSFTMLSNHPQS